MLRYELLVCLAFAAPALLALLMPGLRTLALCGLVIGCAITIALRRYEHSITEATDGPDSALFAFVFYAGYAGLVVGGLCRAVVLAIKLHLGASSRRPPSQAA